MEQARISEVISQIGDRVRPVQKRVIHPRFTAFMHTWMAQRDMTVSGFLRLVYGEAVNASGNPAWGSNARRVLNGTTTPRVDTIEKFAKAMGMNAMELNDYLGSERNRAGRPKAPPVKVGSVATMARAVASLPPAPPPVPTSPPFSMMVNLDGTANVQVHIENVPLDVAAKLLTVLRESGLWK